MHCPGLAHRSFDVQSLAHPIKKYQIVGDVRVVVRVDNARVDGPIVSPSVGQLPRFLNFCVEERMLGATAWTGHDFGSEQSWAGWNSLSYDSRGRRWSFRGQNLIRLPLLLIFHSAQFIKSQL